MINCHYVVVSQDVSNHAMTILSMLHFIFFVHLFGSVSFHSFGSVVEWLERRAHDQHDLGSKPTRAIPLCPWERHFTAHSPTWVLASSSEFQSYLYQVTSG